MDAARLRGAHPGLDLVRLPGSGLAVTTGELNVLPDYLGRPEAIEAAPLRFIGPLIQSVRSWSIAELGRPWDIFDSFPDHVEQDGRLVSLPEWHRGGLRDLCFELFGQRATRAVRVVMSSAFRQLGQPIADGR